MKRSKISLSPSGFAAQTFVFILSTIGITAGATVAIVEAYQKWIVEPRTPSEIRRLNEENDALKSKVKQLEEKMNQSDEQQILEAAQVLRLMTKENTESDPNGVTKAMIRRGLSSDEVELLDLKDASLLVDKALQQGQSPLNSVFGGKIEDLRRKLPTFQNSLNGRIEAYEREHPPRKGIIEQRIEEVEHPDGPQNGDKLIRRDIGQSQSGGQSQALAVASPPALHCLHPTTADLPQSRVLWAEYA